MAPENFKNCSFCIKNNPEEGFGDDDFEYDIKNCLIYIKIQPDGDPKNEKYKIADPRCLPKILYIDYFA